MMEGKWMRRRRLKRNLLNWLPPSVVLMEKDTSNVIPIMEVWFRLQPLQLVIIRRWNMIWMRKSSFVFKIILYNFPTAICFCII